jgi:hypothetical protein
MKIIAKKGFPHMTLGFISKDTPTDVPDDEGKRLVYLGLVEEIATYDTKIVSEKHLKTKKAK